MFFPMEFVMMNAFAGFDGGEVLNPKGIIVRIG